MRRPCIDRYEHVERSMRVFVSTVMNMWNGRYETTFRWLSPDYLKAFARLSVGFRPIISMFSRFHLHLFTQSYHDFHFLSYIVSAKRGVGCSVFRSATSRRNRSVWGCCAVQNSGWCPWQRCSVQTCYSGCR